MNLFRRPFFWILIAALVGGASGSAAADELKLGSLEFPTSGAPAAQPHFIEGVLLLHSFEYEDARERFVRAREIDPGFAMAYWGEAMTHNHPIWLRQNREEGLAALNRLAPTPEERAARAPTSREKDWLATLDVLFGEGDKLARDRAYSDALRRMHERYPDDLEIASFYALSLLGTCHDGRHFPTYMKAAAEVEDVFAVNPDHPGAAHYLIHSYDEAVHAPLGLRAANVYARIAPSAPHAQHMPSHIFLALGMWDATVSSNQRSWDASENRKIAKDLDVDARGYHALQWQAYAFLQQGRPEAAAKSLALVRADAESSGTRRTRWYLARMRAMQVIESERWDAMDLGIDKSDLGIVTSVGDSFARALSALKTGKPELARELLGELAAHREARVSEIEAGCHTADSSYGQDNLPALQAAEIMEQELRALLKLAAGEEDAGIALLREAAEAEAAMSFEFGPPDIVKPSHELLGEVLLERGRAEEALAAFDEALSRAPGRRLSLLGRLRAAAALGREAEVAETYATLRANLGEVPELAELIPG
jgi:tetratricopeptide (TPR) repeat protein